MERFIHEEPVDPAVSEQMEEAKDIVNEENGGTLARLGENKILRSAVAAATIVAGIGAWKGKELMHDAPQLARDEQVLNYPYPFPQEEGERSALLELAVEMRDVLGRSPTMMEVVQVDALSQGGHTEEMRALIREMKENGPMTQGAILRFLKEYREAREQTEKEEMREMEEKIIRGLEQEPTPHKIDFDKDIPPPDIG